MTRTPKQTLPGLQGQMIFDKGAKTIQWGKDNLLNQWYAGNWIFTCKSMKLGMTNSKGIADLNIRAKTIKLPDETGKSFTTLKLAVISWI